jgi:hypothetical protein
MCSFALRDLTLGGSRAAPTQRQGAQTRRSAPTQNEEGDRKGRPYKESQAGTVVLLNAGRFIDV